MSAVPLHLALYEVAPGAPSGLDAPSEALREVMVADLTAWARELEFGTNRHGYSTLSCLLPIYTIDDVFRWYEAARALAVVLSDGAGVVWEGRLEAPRVTAAGLAIRALGYQRALSDLPYTAAWIVTSYGEWEEPSDSDAANFKGQRYETDNNNRLYIAPRAGESYAVSIDGALSYATPVGSSRPITRVTFTYNLTASSSWTAYLIECDRDYASPSAIWSLVGNGGTQTGTATVTVNSKSRVWFSLRYTGVVTAYAGLTGDTFFRATGVSVRTVTTSTVEADDIVLDLIDHVASVNPAQLEALPLSGTPLSVFSPGVALTDEVYEDASPAAILDKLAALGDDQTPPREWEWGVWEGRRLHFAPVGTGARTWYVDATDLEVERPLDALANSMYAVYRDARGVTQRTAVATDEGSVARWRLTRGGVVGVTTTSATTAELHRDLALSDRREVRGRARFRFEALYDAQGARHAPWRVRAGDKIVLRNLPPGVVETIDELRMFYVAETMVDGETGATSVTPRYPLPALEVLVARRAAGVGLPGERRTPSLSARFGRGWMDG